MNKILSTLRNKTAMDPKLQKLLQNNRADGVFHTHVSMIQPKGKYHFNREGLENLWRTYCDIMIKDPGMISGIAEKPQNYLPVLVDIDLKVREEKDNIDDLNDRGLYDNKSIKQIIEIYQAVLRNIVDECTEDNLLCVLLEKPAYRIQKGNSFYYKNGVHLHFPNCFLSKADQEVHVIPRVMIELDKIKPLEPFGFTNSEDFIDKSCCKVPWLMYGSSKSEGMQTYSVTKVFNSSMKELPLEQAFAHYHLFDRDEELINIKGKVKYYLPRILSILPYGRDSTDLKPGLVSPLKEQLRRKKRENRKTVNSISVKKALKIASRLIPMFADFRSEDYNEWMTIGWALYNISNGSPDGLDLWCNFSSRSEQYEESKCIYHWERMVKKDLTLGTLRYYANIDNPDEYMKFKQEEMEHYTKESLDGSHTDIAKAMHALYGDEFVCGSIANRLWYQFIDHKWEMIEEGVFLRRKISETGAFGILDKFVQAGKDLYSQMANADKASQAMLQTRHKQIMTMIRNLKTSPYKSNIMKEAAEIFYDKRFKEKLDTNPYIIGFKNGVYDLKTNKFRPGRPEDFISKCMPIDYINYNEDDEKVHDVYSFLEQVFPDKSVRTYFMDTASDIFVGGNHQKQVYFWLGEGDNGKSVTQAIFEQMLGPLAIKFNTTVVTGKKPTSGSAYADLARAGGGVRWAVLEEPDGDELINVGVLKHLSGNDSFYARDLFEKGKDGREIKPMFKLLFICNKLPRLKHADKATFNRIRVIPFESTFCRPSDPAPSTYEEQLLQKRFPMDKNFGKKIPGMLPAFAWVLLKHRLTITSRIEPEKVRIATAQYQRDNDIYRRFTDESLIEDEKGQIQLTELYGQFKEWFHDEGLPKSAIPVKGDVLEHYTRLWGDPSKTKIWKGYRARTLQDDVESGDAIVLEQEDLVDYNNVSNLPVL